MTVHRSGPIAVVAGDLQTTHRGTTIALKMIDWGGGGVPALHLVKRDGTAWTPVGAAIYEFYDDTTGVGGYAHLLEAQKMGGLLNWVKQVLIPKINAALLKMFPALDGGVIVAPPPPSGTGNEIDELDALLIKTLKWAPQPDGTLKVTA